jgi:hypothetical protein
MVGCGDDRVHHRSAAETLAAAEQAHSDQGRSGTLVASGDELEIDLDRYEHFLQEHPELDKPAALEQLIDRDLLAKEALERGIQDDHSLGVVRKRAMVRELLRARVEGEITEDDLSEDELDAAIGQVRREVGHPPGVQASHLVVLVPPEKKKKASKEQIDAWFEQSRTWLDTLRAQLPDKPNALDLLKVRDANQDEVPEPLKATVNAHMIFPVGSLQDFGADFPGTWRNVVPGFRDAAQKLAREGRFGELSEPVKTEFGWHVIVAEEALAAKRGDAEDIRELARWRVLRQKRNARFTELMKKWASKAKLQTFPKVISEAEELNN